MPKKKPSALDALTALDAERRLLETRGADVRRAAALELGHVVLDAGGASLGIMRLRELVKAAVDGSSGSQPPADGGATARNRAHSAPRTGERSDG